MNRFEIIQGVDGLYRIHDTATDRYSSHSWRSLHNATIQLNAWKEGRRDEIVAWIIGTKESPRKAIQ
jgi:hypothetical protein